MLEAWNDSTEYLEYQVKLSCTLAAMYKELNRFELSTYYCALAIQISIRVSVPYSHLLELLRMTFLDYDSENNYSPEKPAPLNSESSKEALHSIKSNGSGKTSPTAMIQSQESSLKSTQDINVKQVNMPCNQSMDCLIVEEPEIREGSIGRKDEIKILEYLVKSSLQEISKKVVERFSDRIVLLSPIGLMIITD